jgi:hypothetical protein
MATTWIKSLHISKTMTKSSAVAAVIDYVENSQKTDGGRLITSYECDSRLADEQFLLAKQEYEYITARNQGKHDVIAYHIRQAFMPGEVTPEEANEIGRQLVLSFTKGKHAFVVATHIDRAHTHNHIIFNSTTLDCTHKFNDFKRSDRAIRRISDLLCAEHGLSIIENPAPSKGFGDKWRGGERKPSWKSVLREKIDDILPSCTSFESFLESLRTAGYTVNEERKYISVLAPGQKKPTRLKSLGDEYTEAAIRARLGRVKIIASSNGSGTRSAPSLLIDIGAKIREGKGAGYEQWAKIFNLKQAAKTLIFLQEQGIDSYEDLKRKAAAASNEFNSLTEKIKDADKRLNGISELQKQIGAYGKTRAVYDAYKKSGWDRSFYDANTADIILHRAAKKFFDEHDFKTKLPSMNSLKQDFAATLSEKKKLYADYHRLKSASHDLSVALGNAKQILSIASDTPEREDSRTTHNRNTHER